MTGDFDWLMEYPAGDFSWFDDILFHAPLHELVKLTIENEFEHDDDHFWSYVHGVVAERQLEIPAEDLIRDLREIMDKLRESIAYLFHDFEFFNVYCEYRLAEVRLDKPSSSMLLRFSYEG